jgi:hypothetical protein
VDDVVLSHVQRISDRLSTVLFASDARNREKTANAQWTERDPGPEKPLHKLALTSRRDLAPFINFTLLSQAASYNGPE